MPSESLTKLIDSLKKKQKQQDVTQIISNINEEVGTQLNDDELNGLWTGLQTKKAIDIEYPGGMRTTEVNLSKAFFCNDQNLITFLFYVKGDELKETKKLMEKKIELEKKGTEERKNFATCITTTESISITVKILFLLFNGFLLHDFNELINVKNENYTENYPPGNPFLYTATSTEITCPEDFVNKVQEWFFTSMNKFFEPLTQQLNEIDCILSTEAEANKEKKQIFAGLTQKKKDLDGKLKECEKNMTKCSDNLEERQALEILTTDLRKELQKTLQDMMENNPTNTNIDNLKKLKSDINKNIQKGQNIFNHITCTSRAELHVAMIKDVLSKIKSIKIQELGLQCDSNYSNLVTSVSNFPKENITYIYSEDEDEAKDKSYLVIKINDRSQGGGGVKKITKKSSNKSSVKKCSLIGGGKKTSKKSSKKSANKKVSKKSSKKGGSLIGGGKKKVSKKSVTKKVSKKASKKTSKKSVSKKESKKSSKKGGFQIGGAKKKSSKKTSKKSANKKVSKKSSKKMKTSKSSNW